MNSDNWDYIAAGFDKFLSRGDTPNLSGSLDQEVTVNNAIAFDRGQVSGAFGDTVRIGNILLDGANSRIIMNDGTNDVLLIGNDES